MSTPTRITHLIGHQEFDGSAERTSEVYNPATGQVTGTLDLASAEVVDRVVQHAAAAAKQWGSTSLAKRTPVLFKFRQLLDENKERIAEIITSEHGKVTSDALGEVTRGLEVAEFACGIPQLLKGGYSENVSTGVDAYSILQPLGVVAVISPFNFPVMVPLWFVPIAVACFVAYLCSGHNGIYLSQRVAIPKVPADGLAPNATLRETRTRRTALRAQNRVS